MKYVPPAQTARKLAVHKNKYTKLEILINVNQSKVAAVNQVVAGFYSKFKFIYWLESII